MCEHQRFSLGGRSVAGRLDPRGRLADHRRWPLSARVVVLVPPDGTSRKRPGTLNQLVVPLATPCGGHGRIDQPTDTHSTVVEARSELLARWAGVALVGVGGVEVRSLRQGLLR